MKPGEGIAGKPDKSLLLEKDMNARYGPTETCKHSESDSPERISELMQKSPEDHG